jgi:hypothetical protein
VDSLSIPDIVVGKIPEEISLRVLP